MAKTGFSMIPNQLINDERLSKESKLLFIYLRYLSPKFRTLRNKTLLDKLDICLSTLQKSKTELVKYDYLVIHRKTSANHYVIRVPIKQVCDRVLNTHVGKYNLLNISKNNTTLYNNILHKEDQTNFKGFKKLKGFKEND